MARDIGFDNNPAGSALVLGLAKFAKDWMLKKTTGKAHDLIARKLSIKALGKGLVKLNVANAAGTTLQDFLPHVNAGVAWTVALPVNVLNQTIGRIPVVGSVFRGLVNCVTTVASTLADFIGLDYIADMGRTIHISDPNSGFETNIDWKSGDIGLEAPAKEDERKEDKLIMSTNNTKDSKKNPNVNTGNRGASTRGYKTRSKIMNSPSFYEHLDLHKTFSIPGAYTKKTLVNGTMGIPKIAVHRLFENPVPDVSAMVDRINQKYSLIKAVRGLSATNYDIVDLANYERFAKLCLVVYYTVKKVISAAKTYSLVQCSVGDNIIRAYGFQPAEVRRELANYETLLCQMNRFITNNLPMSGLWIKRLEYLLSANVPDYTDDRIATVHMFSVSMADVFYDATDPEGSGFVFDAHADSDANEYSIVLSEFIEYQSAIVNNSKWQQLIADYFGAFGSQAIWSDPDYPSYAQPLNLRNADNDLSREQIKNAMYGNMRFIYSTWMDAAPEKKQALDYDDPHIVQCPGYQFGVSDVDTLFNTRLALKYNNLLQSTTYLECKLDGVKVGSGGPNFLLFPDHNGVGATALEIPNNGSVHRVAMNNNETIYTLHKDSYTEGESLEISQFKCRSLGYEAQLTTEGTLTISCVLKAHEYLLMDTAVFAFSTAESASVQDTVFYLMDEAYYGYDLQSNQKEVDLPFEIMAWSMIDWMPMLHYTFFELDRQNKAYAPHDVCLMDFDAYGSLDNMAFSTSINYSIYSLQAAGLTIGAKRVDNLGAVYKDKANKRG